MDKQQFANYFAANDQMVLPLIIPMQNCSQPFIAKQVLRLIPNRRVVLLGQWHNKQVVAKLFLNPKQALRQVERELAGISKLQQADIYTPELIHQNNVAGTNIQILLFEYVYPSVRLEELWFSSSISNRQRIVLLKSLLLLIARHHRAGIVQRDLHLKNFLLAHNHIYTLDPAELSVVERLGKKASLKHLGLLFAQLTPEYDELWQTAFSVYAKARDWPVTNADLAMLLHYGAKHRQTRQQKYLKKVFRECSAIVSRKTWSRWIVCQRDAFSAAMEQFLNDPEIILKSSNTTVIKAGNTCTVYGLQYAGRSMIVKRYNIKSLWHRLKRCWRESRAVTCWRNAHRLMLLGISTAKPIAFIEERFGPLRGRAYFIMEHIKGIPANQYFGTLDNTRELMAQKIIVTLHRLFEQHLTHGDLKATNILLANDQAYLIDLDGMCQRSTSACMSRALQRDIKRFLKNWPEDSSEQVLFKQLLAQVGYKAYV